MKNDGYEISMDESDGAWHVFVPGMERLGAATWGKTKEEAKRNIGIVMEMIAEEED